MSALLTWLDAKLFGYRRILQPDDTDMPDRPTLKFAGSGDNSVVDDMTNNRTVVTISAGAGGVSESRKVIAGPGLKSDPVAPATLEQDITLQVDVITDAMHGSRGNGSLHTVASTGTAGFMSAADKTKLNGIEAGANIGIASVVEGQGIEVDATDPANPVVSAPRLDDSPGALASQGAVRLASEEFIMGRSYADDADVVIVELDSDNRLTFGDAAQCIGHEINAKTGGLWRWLVNSVEVVRLNASQLLFGSAVSPGIGQVAWSGTGSNAGTAFTLAAQDGQNVLVGTNNNGGKLKLSSGAAGAGGSGGVPGDVEMQVGGTAKLTVSGSGAAATFATDKVEGKAFTAALYDSGDASGAVDLEFGKSQNIYVGALASNVTFTYTGVQAGARYHVIVRQHASSAKTTTWPATTSFVTGDDAVGTILDSYTVWQFGVLPNGRLICINRKADIRIP